MVLFRLLLLLLLLSLSAIVVSWIFLVRYADRRFEEALVEAESVIVAGVEVGEAVDGIAPVRITGEGGIESEGLLLLPPGGAEEARVGIVLIGGIGTGKNAAKLVDPIPGAVVLAVDYPLKERLPRGSVITKARALPSMVDGIAESVLSFSLAREWLASRVDIEKVAVVGVSLGVPFAAALAAGDDKPDAVALLYGGGDAGRIVTEALPGRPLFLKRIVGSMLGRVIARYDPARLAPEIAPCPVLLVNDRADRRIPPESVAALHAAAVGPKKIVYLEGGHILPQKEGLLRRLIGETTEWLAELHIL